MSESAASRILKMKRPTAITVALIFGMLVITGCGYDQSGGDAPAAKGGYKWHSLYREDVQTVAVPIFGTRDFRRDVELKLSKAVVNELEAHSPYKVVPRERADTILEGEVAKVEVNNLSRTYIEGVPQEQLMMLTINFTWKDQRTGRILLQKKNFQQTASFYPTLGEGEFVGTQKAVERLALEIVQAMEADW